MSARPRTLRYADALADAEQRVVEPLPGIIDGLIARDRDGDTRAAVYLCDRILGRTTAAKVAPADDREPPYSDEDFRFDEENRQETREEVAMLRRMFARSGASAGA
jgi:hypothetical protein